MIDQIVSLRAVGTSAFIIARCTYGSTNYIFDTNKKSCQLCFGDYSLIFQLM